MSDVFDGLINLLRGDETDDLPDDQPADFCLPNGDGASPCVQSAADNGVANKTPPSVQQIAHSAPQPAAKSPQSVSSSSTRRRPGRPSKAPPVPVFKRVGITETPHDKEHLIEMAWDDPQTFRNIFQFFQKLKAESLELRFSPNDIYIYSEDGKCVMKLMAVLFGPSMLWYYCRSEFSFVLNRVDVDRAFNAIDRNFSRIRIFYKATEPKVLFFELVNDTIDRRTTFPIEVLQFEHTSGQWEELNDFASKEEPLRGAGVSWTLSQKDFKKSCSMANSYSSLLRVEKSHKGCLKISYKGVGFSEFVEKYKSGSKINLQSSVPSDSLLVVNYSTGSLLALASAFPTESVSIFCYEKEPCKVVASANGCQIIASVPVEDV